MNASTMVWVKQKAHQHKEFMYYGPTSKIIYYAVYLEPAQKYILGQQNKLGRTLNGNDLLCAFLEKKRRSSLGKKVMNLANYKNNYDNVNIFVSIKIFIYCLSKDQKVDFEVL